MTSKYQNPPERLKKGQLLKSLCKSNRAVSIEQLPELHSTESVIHYDEAALLAFNRLVEWQQGANLPATWLQVQAFPMYLNLLSNHQVPFSPLGLVHVENKIKVLQPLVVDADYQLQCVLQNYQPHRKGLLFDITLNAWHQDKLVYQGIATNLAILKNSTETTESAQDAQTEQCQAEYPELAIWNLGNGIGRRYAQVSGDYNPIHLHPLCAKLFGFRRHIAHGMYLKARALSSLLKGREGATYSASIAFKKPVMLPEKLSLTAQTCQQQTQFAIKQGAKVHAYGSLDW